METLNQVKQAMKCQNLFFLSLFGVEQQVNFGFISCYA